MRRPVSRRVLSWGLLVTLAVLGGCTSETFAPPAPKRKVGAVAPTAPIRSREVVLVLPREDNTEFPAMEGAARLEAGKYQISFRALKGRPGEGPGRQSELIQQAIVDGASALVVVPDGTDETAKTLAALDPKKTPVILLGRSVKEGATSAEFKPTLVTFPSFDPIAKRIVEAVATDARKAGFAADDPVLFVKFAADQATDDRDAALVEAIKAAKLPIAETVVASSDPTEAKRQMAAALKAHPKAAAIIADDDPGITIAVSVRAESLPKSNLMIAGFTPLRTTMNLVTLNQASILAERSVEALARKAIRVALDRLEGKDVPARVDLDIPVRRAANAVTPTPFQ